MLTSLTSLTIKPLTLAIAGALVLSATLLVAFTAVPAEAVVTDDQTAVATSTSCTLAAVDRTASKCDKAKCDDEKSSCASACSAPVAAMPVAMTGCGGAMASSPCAVEAQAVLAARAKAASECSACCPPKDDKKCDDKATTPTAGTVAAQ